MVCVNDVLYDLTYTIIIQDYIKYKTLPEIDQLLDWRIRLMEELLLKNYPKVVCEQEIMAVDFLLSKHRMK